jgi:hypothetical protein
MQSSTFNKALKAHLQNTSFYTPREPIQWSNVLITMLLTSLIASGVALLMSLT